MAKFDVASGNFFPTVRHQQCSNFRLGMARSSQQDVGRVASHYYIHHESMLKYNEVGFHGQFADGQPLSVRYYSV